MAIRDVYHGALLGVCGKSRAKVKYWIGRGLTRIDTDKSSDMVSYADEISNKSHTWARSTIAKQTMRNMFLPLVFSQRS